MLGKLHSLLRVSTGDLDQALGLSVDLLDGPLRGLGPVAAATTCSAGSVVAARSIWLRMSTSRLTNRRIVPLSSSARFSTQFMRLPSCSWASPPAPVRRLLFRWWGGHFTLGGATQRGERGVQGLGFAAVLGAKGVEGGVGAVAFGGEFVAVLTAQSGEFLAVFGAGLAQFFAGCLGVVGDGLAWWVAAWRAVAASPRAWSRAPSAVWMRPATSVCAARTRSAARVSAVARATAALVRSAASGRNRSSSLACIVRSPRSAQTGGASTQRGRRNSASR